MSITPPTDIVLDVARAADPTRYSEAAARLTRAATVGGDEFATFLKATAAPTVAAAPQDSAKGEGTRAGKAYQSFEAMTLATMIESAMPDEAGSYFGSGTAGSVWKSMLAGEIAKQMAERGGVGIATQLAKSSQAALTADDGQISAGNAVRSLLVANAERGFVSGLGGGTSDDSGT